MQTFRSRLERVLAVRRREAEARLSTLERAMTEWQAADAAFAEAEAFLGAWRAQWLARQKEGMAGSEWQLLHRSDQTLAQRALTARNRAAAAGQRAALARAAHMAARQKVEMLEKLLDRQRAEHRSAQEELQQQEMDAIALSRFIRGEGRQIPSS